jgi:hypothetical protein
MENNTILNSSISTTVDSVLNLTSMIIDILALLVCLTLLCTIIYRLIRIKYNRNQMKIDVPSILAINTLCIIIIKSTMQIIHVTVPTLLKEHFFIEFVLICFGQWLGYYIGVMFF